MQKTISVLIIATLFSLSIFGQTKKDSLYVFVGKKIEVVGFEQRHDSDEILFGRAFKAKYQVIQSLYGSYSKDTIEFEVYDHYGKPAFSQYDYVLLFVSKINGKHYHEKYQYFDVYKTKNGRWASGFKARDYGHSYNTSTNVKPEIIDFVDEISYDIRSRNKDEIKLIFPAPFYKIEDDKAIVIWGNYVEELFELKKAGILKARGIF